MLAHSPPDESPPMSATGDPAISVEALATAHGGDVYAAALRVTGEPAQAEDIQQTVFIRLLERPPSASIQHWKAYLCAMATRSAIDELRRAQRWQRFGDHWLSARVSPDPQPQARLSGQERARTLRQALGRIPRKQAECFALRFFDGLELSEIASLLSTTPNAVSVSLNRASKSLRERIARIESSSKENRS